MLKPPDKAIIPKLQEIKGKWFTYKDFATTLGLPIKTSYTIDSQINSLKVYCNIEVKKKPKPAKYMVVEVFNPNTPHLSQSKANNPYQVMFETLLYKHFQFIGKKEFYCSYKDLFFLFGMANRNFFTSMSNKIKILNNYKYMYSLIDKVYPSLKQWMVRKIDTMCSNGLLSKHIGYRLYKFYDGSFIPFELAIDSDEYAKCDKIYKDTYKKYMGNSRGWIPVSKKKIFDKELSERIKEEFNGEYIILRRVQILSLPDEVDIHSFKCDKAKALEYLGAINKECCEKVESIQSIPADKRKEFVDICINRRGERIVDLEALCKEQLKENKEILEELNDIFMLGWNYEDIYREFYYELIKIENK